MNLDFLKVIITLLCLIAVYQDLTSRRVSNQFVVFGFFTILLSSFWVNEWSVFLHGFSGFASALGVGFLLWRFRVLGAGDIKVMSIIALTLPWERSLEFIFYTLVWGSLLGAFSLLLDLSLLQESRALNFNPMMTIRSSKVKAHKIPYTVCILLGIFSVWLLASKGVVFI